MKEWKAADIVKLTEGKYFIVVGNAIDEKTKKSCVVFRALNGETPLKVLDKKTFDKIFTLAETH